MSMLYSITDFEFIVTFVTVYHFLSHLVGITVKLQGKTLDIVDAYNGISSIVTFYRSLRQILIIVFTTFLNMLREWLKLLM